MKKIALGLLIGALCFIFIYWGASAIYGWHETGSLATHRKLAVGPDYLDYPTTPGAFMWEISGYVLFIIAGLVGLGSVYAYLTE